MSRRPVMPAFAYCAASTPVSAGQPLSSPLASAVHAGIEVTCGCTQAMPSASCRRVETEQPPGHERRLDLVGGHGVPGVQHVGEHVATAREDLVGRDDGGEHV